MRSSQGSFWGGVATLHHLQNKRAFNPETQKYLHLSGRGETADETYAWRGSKTQFDNLQPGAQYVLVTVKDKAPTIREGHKKHILEEEL